MYECLAYKNCPWFKLMIGVILHLYENYYKFSNFTIC